jgi:hypothetical protein
LKIELVELVIGYVIVFIIVVLDVLLHIILNYTVPYYESFKLLSEANFLGH